MNTALQRWFVVDDDDIFRERLALSLRRRGYEALAFGSAAECLKDVGDPPPDAAVVDLKMPLESGLHLVRKLKDRFPGLRILVLTGYGSIATATEAIRLGAVDYLTKPADTDQIENALNRNRPFDLHADEATVPSLDRVEWEHLQRVLHDCDGNISKAARSLGIERRTLQRKLQKYPPTT